ncbi:MAG: YggS family pyridoxal phosphate-dependent enzyme [Acidobacteriota bacterium]
MEQLGKNLERVRARIADAAARARRSPDDVRLVAVSKTFPPAMIRAAAEFGQRCFGENRVQEAREKIHQLEDLDLEWHLVGHLQSNKAKTAVELFDVIQSVDGSKLAARLDRYARETGFRLPVLIEVNVGEEPQKAGVVPAAVEPLVRSVLAFPNLELRGLMAIPPFLEDPEGVRPYFRKLRELRDELEQRLEVWLPDLSMGMSSDFEVAVEEGATIVRVGTAIFGERSV